MRIQEAAELGGRREVGGGKAAEEGRRRAVGGADYPGRIHGRSGHESDDRKP